MENMIFEGEISKEKKIMNFWARDDVRSLV